MTKEEVYQKLRTMFTTLLDRHTVDIIFERIEASDPAHDVFHVYSVVMLAKELSSYVPPSDCSYLMVAALMHDIGSGIDRKNHHIVGARLSGEILLSDSNYTNVDAVYRVANAILQHRASFKEARIDPVSTVLAAADRGKMDNPDAMMIRACMTKEGTTEDLIPWRAFELAWQHGIEKFGPNGYAWDTLPSLSAKVFAKNIELMKKTFCESNRHDYVSHAMTDGLIDYHGNHWKYGLRNGDFSKQPK